MSFLDSAMYAASAEYGLPRIGILKREALEEREPKGTPAECSCCGRPLSQCDKRREAPYR